MTWKTKRAIGTAVAALVPYLGMAFVGWDFAWPLATETTRYCLLSFAGGAGAATYTYPGWRW